MKELYATIDLGSNSFHMLTAALEHNEIKILESLSEKVMLADGLSKDQGISPDAMERGLACAERFAQRISSIPKDNIRIVGTNTLRAAKNSSAYVAELERVFDGLAIDIVSGIEEARLIYLGVNHSWSNISQITVNLVSDIGGGSTEFILGKGFKLKKAESLRMGCVAFRRFFPREEINLAAFESAVRAAKLELTNIKSEFKSNQLHNVIGSAGTFKAIERLLVENGFSEEGITFSGLKQLKASILEFDNFSSIELKGLKSLRERTIVPGLAITWAIFQSLGIKTMHISRGGLREGILYDLIGRLKSEDIRLRSIDALSRRYHVPKERSSLYVKLCKKLVNNMTFSGEQELRVKHQFFLSWAAHCCRIGLAINHSQYQIHSAYLIQHSELSGFSIKERNILSNLVRNHRRKINTESAIQLLSDTQNDMRYLVLVYILRLAIVIGQNGKENRGDKIKIFVSDLSEKSLLLEVNVDSKWLEKHPLISHAMESEVKYWSKAGLDLEVKLLKS